MEGLKVVLMVLEAVEQFFRITHQDMQVLQVVHNLVRMVQTEQIYFFYVKI
jgi:hypothetical protein